MSARGAEGILAQRKAAAAQPVDTGTAGHHGGRVSGAAKGAAGGAVAGPEGAAAGALTGLLSGGKGKRHGGNKALVAEFAICMVLLALSPMVDKGADLTVGKWMKKASATAAVFVILGFISATGDTGRKAASGFGLLVTLTVLLNERSVFGVLVKATSGKDVPVTAGPSHPAANAPAPDNSGGGGGLDFSDPYSLGASVGNDIRQSVTGAIGNWETDLEAQPGDNVITKVFHEIGGWFG